MNLVRIRLQNGLQNLRLADSAVCDFHPLNGVELIAHKLLQGILKFRITFITKMRCKAHDRGLADADYLPQLCRRKKHRLVIIVRNISRQPLLPFAQFAVSIINAVTQVIRVAHTSPRFCGMISASIFLLYQIRSFLQENPMSHFPLICIL